MQPSRQLEPLAIVQLYAHLYMGHVSFYRLQFVIVVQGQRIYSRSDLILPYQHSGCAELKIQFIGTEIRDLDR